MRILNIQLAILFTIVLTGTFSYAQAVIFPSHPLTIQSPLGPTLNDPRLKAVIVYSGLKFPTTMAFLGPNDILVLEKNEGLVQRILNGTMLPHPLLRVNVANEAERGLLGIMRQPPTFSYIAHKPVEIRLVVILEENNRLEIVFIDMSL